LLWVWGRLVAELNRRTCGQRWHGLRLLAIDHTTLTLPETPALWKRFRSHRGQQGLGPVAAEFACVFHVLTRAPFFYTIAAAATSDHDLIPKLVSCLRKGDLVLIDNGFYSLKTFLSLGRQGVHFLIPSKTTHRPKVLRQLGPSDYLCRIQSGRDTLVVRVVYVEQPGFRRRRLVTSLLDLTLFPAAEFPALYHLRWGIETFYRDLKSTLRITHWHCRTPATFEQELVVHLIVVCLIRRVMLEAAAQAQVSPARLSFARCLARIRIFFRRLPQLLVPELPSLQAALVHTCAALRLSFRPGRRFSRNPQEYRRKARGLPSPGRGRKPVPPVPFVPTREVSSDNYLLP
jgi:hypothetical protein